MISKELNLNHYNILYFNFNYNLDKNREHNLHNSHRHYNDNITIFIISIVKIFTI